MATTDLDVTSITSATGWTGATVANLSTSNDVRATDGTAGELILAQLSNSPGDFSSQNTVTLHVEARVVGTVSRAKTVLVELLDSGGTLLQSFTTSNLTSSDVTYDSSNFSRADSAATIDGYQLRCTVQEGGGMADSATVEIDRMWATLDYNAAVNTQADPGTGLLAAAGFAAAVILGTVAAPGVGAVSATSFAPTVTATNHIAADPGVGAATLAGFATGPTVAPTLRSLTSAASSGGTTSLTVNVPAGVQDGDLLVTVIGAFSDRTITAPGAWGSPVESIANGTIFLQFRAYQRVASSEPASYAWGLDTNSDLVAACLCFHGGGQTTIGVHGSNWDSTIDSTARATGITTDVLQSTLVAAYLTTAGSAVTFTPPSGMTERADLATTSSPAGSPISLSADSQTLNALGATGVRDATMSASPAHGNLALTLEIRGPLAQADAGAGTAALAGFAPTVTATQNRTASPSAGLLTASGFAPTISAGSNTSATPGAGDGILTGLAPTVTASDHLTASPGLGALTATGLAPTVAAGVGAAPGAGAGVLAGLAPTVSASANVSAAPGLGALTATGLAPVVTASDHQTAAPGTGTLAAAGIAPTIHAGTTAATLTGALAASGFAPTVSTTAHVTAAPGTGLATVAGFVPTVTASSAQSAAPGTGGLTATGLAPSIAAGTGGEPGVGLAVLAGFAPTVSVTTNTQADTGTGVLVLTGFELVPAIEYSFTVSNQSGPRYVLTDQAAGRYALTNQSGPRYVLEET